MKTLIYTVVLFAVIFGAGYLLLRFFSRLSGIDTFAAISWAFKAKKFLIVLPLFPLFFMGLFFTYAIIIQPISQITAGGAKIGGLAGYREDDNFYAYYDTSDRAYTRIKSYSPPPDSWNLDRVLSVVAFYKSKEVDHYVAVNPYQYIASIAAFIFAVGGLVPAYFLLHAIVNGFASSGGAGEKISHLLIRNNFTQITGFRFWTVLGAAVFVILAATIIANHLSGRILREQKETLGRVSTEHIKKILRTVTPGKRISGTIVRREYDPEKVYTSRDESSMKSRDNESHYEPAYNYTVRFTGLTDIPVYVVMRIHGDTNSNPVIKRLDSLFANTEVKRTMYGSHSPDTIPIKTEDLEFIVRPDYSIGMAE